MAYVIRGLPAQSFQPLFGLDDAALEARGMRRYVADGPGYPCRISLEDAAPGESLILLHWNHLDADSPYRSAGPIFVRESARPQAAFHNMVPEQQRSRLLSVRAYDAQGWMLDAEVDEGERLEGLIERFFADARTAFLHVHNARRGCYACRVDRG
ncbi:DUF1203 domain-containing protein [Luteimonas sp. 8-5]|uniref:DUF1203 domain-containing protein n=1 Tax=Luteimonas sp. 8-5 TaxID=3039387 RepID=UPI002436536E|nr:DUF1203 domain-containing protein [Luteimonas sp. 8-5]MDG6349498.1 DUF1203 domain-containing protein [Luteimonas sp. 8-5]